jgi:pyruvate,water dikinase
MTSDDSVRWFADLAVTDAGTVGGKGANLGELTRAGFPVPAGFVITAQAYLHTVESAGLRRDLAAAAAGVPIADPAALSDLSDSLRKRIRNVEIPDDVCGPILAAYRDLQARRSRCARRQHPRTPRARRSPA